MKQISLNVSKLKKVAFTQFITETVNVLTAYNVTHSNPQIQDFIQRLGEDLPQLTESLMIQQGSSLTKKLVDQTQARNLDYQTLKAGLRFYQHNRQVEKVEAYQLLYPLFRQSQFANRFNQPETFAILDSLLKKLRQSPYQEAIQLLDLEEPLSHLEESHAKTYQLFFQRNQATKSGRKVDFQSVRTRVSKNYRLLQNYLTLQVGLNPKAPEQELLTSLNDMCRTFTKIDRRKTEKSSDSSPTSANMAE